MPGKSKKGEAAASTEEPNNDQKLNDAQESSDETMEAKSAENSEQDAPEAAEKGGLEEQLERAQKKAEENWDLALRTKAEMENLRKRTKRDIENAHKYALEKIAAELLNVRDSMELGLGAAQQEQVDVNSLREGAELTLKMLKQLMEKFEILELNPENEKFDPELHQAMSMQESDKLDPNTVISVIQKGYTLSGRLLRPALVTVSKAASSDSKS